MIFKAIRMTLSQIWKCLYENRVLIGLCIAGLLSTVVVFCLALWLTSDPIGGLAICTFYFIPAIGFVERVHTNYEKLKEKENANDFND